jgi:hypothetical protein
LLPLSDPSAGPSLPCRRRPWWPTTGGWRVWLLVFLIVARSFFLLANKSAYGSGSSSGCFPPCTLDHGDDDGARICGNEGGGVYAFAALPDPWRQSDSSAAAPYSLPHFLSNNLVAGRVPPLYVCYATAMVAGAKLARGGFMASAFLCGSDLVDSVSSSPIFCHRGDGQFGEDDADSSSRSVLRGSQATEIPRSSSAVRRIGFLLLLLHSQADHGGLARDWTPASTCGDGGVGDIIELIYDGGKTASATLCRQGGDIQTSTVEAFHLRCGCSKLPGHEVMRSPWLGSGPRRQINVGRGLPSSWPLFLGGNAWRTPAKCGGGTDGLDCFRSSSSRVLCVKSRVLSSNSRFPRARDARTFVEIVPATLQ